MKLISPPKPNCIQAIFNNSCALIGVIHLKPLPGSPNYNKQSINEIIDIAVSEAIIFEENGFDGVIIENHGDIPFLKPNMIGFETVSIMTSVSVSVKREIKLKTGINVLANGASQSIAIAKAINADFIRANQWVNAYIANEGFIEGEASRVLRYRKNINAEDVKIFSDVLVKHGSHAITNDRDAGEQIFDSIWSDSDAIIITGNRTGDAVKKEEVINFKGKSQLPVLIGSGVNIDNVKNLLSVCDGCIVSSSLKKNGLWWENLDKEKVKLFVDKFNE